MDVLAWEKRIVNPQRYNEETKYEVFIYKNPLITPPKKENECYRIDTVNFDYKEWEIVNNILSEKPNGFFLGKGFRQDFFLYLNEKLTLDLISNKTGIDKKHLEVMLKKNEGI
jgi:hypothetical protein